MHAVFKNPTRKSPAVMKTRKEHGQEKHLPQATTSVAGEFGIETLTEGVMNIIVAHLHSPKKLQDLVAAIRIYVHVKPHKHHFWHSDLISLKLTSNAFH